MRDFCHVTLRVRVWIETPWKEWTYTNVDVTLRVRVWIETSRSVVENKCRMVTLRVRVWIETLILWLRLLIFLGHPPCEGVD